MTDNTVVNLMQMGDHVYAMTETDTMMKVDPNTLQTEQPVSGWGKVKILHSEYLLRRNHVCGV